ncbi:MAG: glycosyltransferase [Alphaproteobacteria bacterium]|nr:MAG: glycosyltransferase [Alphaproteobacteria bacterium]
MPMAEFGVFCAESDREYLVLDGSRFPAPAGFRLVSTDEIREGGGTPARVIHPDPGLKLALAPDRAMPGGWYQFELQLLPEGLVDVVAQFSFADDRVLWLRLPLFGRNHFLAHFRLEGALQCLTLVITGSGRLTDPTVCRFVRIGLRGQLTAALRRGVDIFRRDGLGVFASGLNYLWRLTRPGSIAISRGSAAKGGEAPYDTWIRIFDEAPERDRARHEERLATLTQPPLMSVLAELSAAAPLALDRLARSVAEQIYPAWELVLAAPVALQGEIGAALAARGVEADRLRMVNAGANRAETLNMLLAVSQGEFVLPLAERALLRPHALLDLALAAEGYPSVELIYTDEDRIDQAGHRSDWRFKPAWSPDLLQAWDYVGQVTLMRRETVRSLGGGRPEAPSPEHDLLLRLTKKIEPRGIMHLAKILVHAAVAPDMPARTPAAPVRNLPGPRPRVSLIIPTRDNAEVLATCIRSIRARTRYDNYEIIIVDNGSVEQKTRRLFAEWSSDASIRILPMAEPFNFSRLNNAAAREATGDILGLVNNDVEATHEDWLAEMAVLAMRPDVGCVGAKLLYPDGRIQHAGIVIGLGGVAGHGHRFARGNDPGYLGRLRTVQNVSAVTAACLLVRKQVFDQVNGLDESLTVAFNDVDFCLRVRAAGYLNVWTPFAELTHHESASRGRDLTPSKARRFASEYATMQRRWGAALLRDPYYSPHLTYDREDFSLRLR